MVVHHLNDLAGIRRVQKVREFHGHLDEVGLHGVTGEVAEEVEEVVVAGGAAQQQLLGHPHVLLEGAQLVKVTAGQRSVAWRRTTYAAVTLHFSEYIGNQYNLLNNYMYFFFHLSIILSQENYSEAA